MAKSAAKSEEVKRPEWARDLNDREYAFVCEYLVDLNGRQAIKRLGWHTENDPASDAAYVLMRKPVIARAIEMAMEASAAGPRQWLITKLAAIADGDLSEIGSWEKNKFVLKDSDKISPEIRKLIKKIHTTKDGDVRVELHDPLRAIELLGKVGAIGLTKEKIALEGNVTLEQLVMDSMKPKSAE